MPSGIKKSLSVVDIESILMKGRRSKKKKKISN